MIWIGVVGAGGELGVGLALRLGVGLPFVPGRGWAVRSPMARAAAVGTS